MNNRRERRCSKLLEGAAMDCYQGNSLLMSCSWRKCMLLAKSVHSLFAYLIYAMILINAAMIFAMLLVK